MSEYQFFTYIMTSESGTLYIGMTNHLIRRIAEHKEGKIDGFSKKYICYKLVYYEMTRYVYNVIEREKELKDENGQKKEELIKEGNPEGKNLYSTLVS